jgi:hypothetical protein
MARRTGAVATGAGAGVTRAGTVAAYPRAGLSGAPRDVDDVEEA